METTTPDKIDYSALFNDPNFQRDVLAEAAELVANDQSIAPLLESIGLTGTKKQLYFKWKSKAAEIETLCTRERQRVLTATVGGIQMASEMQGDSGDQETISKPRNRFEDEEKRAIVKEVQDARKSGVRGAIGAVFKRHNVEGRVVYGWEKIFGIETGGAPLNPTMALPPEMASTEILRLLGPIENLAKQTHYPDLITPGIASIRAGAMHQLLLLKNPKAAGADVRPEDNGQLTEAPTPEANGSALIQNAPVAPPAPAPTIAAAEPPPVPVHAPAPAVAATPAVPPAKKEREFVPAPRSFLTKGELPPKPVAQVQEVRKTPEVDSTEPARRARVLDWAKKQGLLDHSMSYPEAVEVIIERMKDIEKDVFNLTWRGLKTANDAGVIYEAIREGMIAHLSAFDPIQPTIKIGALKGAMKLALMDQNGTVFTAIRQANEKKGKK